MTLLAGLRSSRPSWSSLVVNVLDRFTFLYALTTLIALVLAQVALSSGGFGLSDQLASAAPFAIVGMASTPGVISGRGGFDLTLSPLMFLTGGIFVVWLVPNGLGGAAAVPILLCVGAAVGALNGFLIVVLRVMPVIVTLSMYFVYLGIVLLLTPSPVSVRDSWIFNLAGSVGPLPGALITICTPLVVWSLLGLSPYKRVLLAVGSSHEAAYSAGINVALVRISAFALGGVFAAIGGMALLAVGGSVTGGLAPSYTLIAIVAVVLGGTSLWGGRGSLIGPLFGGFCIYLLGTLLSLLQISPSWLQIAYGALLVVVVIIQGMMQKISAVQ